MFLFQVYFLLDRRIQDRAENIAISKVYLTVWTINMCPLTILYKVLLNIAVGKGAILLDIKLLLSY